MNKHSILFNYYSADTNALGKEGGDVINLLHTGFLLLRKNNKHLLWYYIWTIKEKGKHIFHFVSR